MPLAVLVADPEQATRSFLGRHLADDGFSVVEARAADEALALAEREHPDLVLLGNPLPDLSALEVCRLLREGEPGRGWDRDVPVIVLDGAEADSVDRVRAFDRGCDDYVARPFVYDELVARMRAILRRTGPRQGDRIVAGAIVVDRRTRSVTVDGVEVALAGKEYELLLKLASDPERVFSEGGAPPRRLGLPLARQDPNAGLPRLSAPAQARARRPVAVRDQRVGRGVPVAARPVASAACPRPTGRSGPSASSCGRSRRRISTPCSRSIPTSVSSVGSTTTPGAPRRSRPCSSGRFAARPSPTRASG